MTRPTRSTSNERMNTHMINQTDTKACTNYFYNEEMLIIAIINFFVKETIFFFENFVCNIIFIDLEITILQEKIKLLIKNYH